MKSKKNDFSFYRRHRDFIYLDYAATTFMPDMVINSWVDYHQNISIGCNRGNGVLSQLAQSEYEKSKSTILSFFEADKEYDIIFGKNATECLNVLAGILKEFLKPGDIILMGPYEHHSNILPWQAVAKATGACMVQLPLMEDGEICYGFIEKIDIKRIKIISISAVSNINSHMIDLNFIKNVMQLCTAFCILDVSQAVGHKKLSFFNIKADAYVMSAHKMYGPKNVGAVVIRKEKIEKLSPYFLGGGMVWNALGAAPTWHTGARKFEAGTFDVGLVKSWSKACEYLSSIGMENICQSDKEIWEYTKKKLNSNKIHIIPGGDIYSSMCSFTIDGIHPHDIAEKLIAYECEIRTGHMCAQETLNNFGVTSLCRISWGIGSSIEDIERFIQILDEGF